MASSVKHQASSTISCSDFSLQVTLTSGQVFRWHPLTPSAPLGKEGKSATNRGGSVRHKYFGGTSADALVADAKLGGGGEGFTGWIGQETVRVVQRDSVLTFQGTSPRAIKSFFSLDVKLASLKRRIDVDPTIHQAMVNHPGLRIIRQEPWECVASFILSSCNNIPRLTGMLERLATHFGEPVIEADKVSPLFKEGGQTPFEGGPAPFGFPSPERLARVSERTLRRLRLGYRAPYLKGAAEAVASGVADLDGWRNLDDEALRRALQTLPGVGEKVADCILLFAYERWGAFPVDVWMGRAMRRWYFRNRKVPACQIRTFARKHFGPACGWAQQFLYCQARGSGLTSSRQSRRPGVGQ